MFNTVQRLFLSLSALLIGILVLPFPLHSAELDELSLDETILIYSSTHGRVNVLSSDETVIKIHVTAFEPISEVRINGKVVRSPGEKRVELSVPVRLHDRKAVTLRVQASTRSGRSRQRFEFYPPPSAADTSSRFYIIGQIGMSLTDNLNNESVSDEKDEALKSTLTLVPVYRHSLSRNSRIVIRGIFLREKLAKDKYSDKEVSFSQAAAQWIVQNTAFGSLLTELGFNDIRTQNKSLLNGEEHSKIEGYVSGTLENQLTEEGRWNAELRMKQKDAIPEPMNANYDGDALELRLTAGIEAQFKDLMVEMDSAYAVNEARGKYKDYSSVSLGFKGSTQFDDWKISIAHDREEKSRTHNDPFYNNIKPHYSIHTVTTKLIYQWFPELFLNGEYKERRQSSNVDELDYQRNTVTVSVSTLF